MAAVNFKVVRVLLIVLVSTFACSTADSPKVLTADDLDTLVQTGKRVVVNFVKENDAASQASVTEIAKVANKLKDDKEVVVGLVTDPELHLEHGVASTPTVIYFRERFPILYTDELQADAIVNFVNENLVPSSQPLTNENFEHLTQASSGATTGDWLVLFYDPEETESLMLLPTIEATAQVLKGRINVGIVDVSTATDLVDRFNIEDPPLVFLFRLGNMYAYKLPGTDVASFVSFATGWYKNARVMQVPVPKSPFDKLAEKVADGAKKFATDAKEKLSEGAKKAKEKIQEQAAKAGEKLKEGAAKAKEKLKEGAMKAKEMLKDKETQKKLGVGSIVVIGAVVLIVTVVCIRRRKKKVKQQ
ncbi:protein disulfide-isomerase A6 homolog isoform X2 [Glandiceps talaboti]